MAFDAHKNFAVSTVATAPSPATSGTSLVVAAGEGSRFPAVPFNATIWPVNTLPTPANSEIVRVTARSTDTLTITRTQESTSARTVVIGDQIAAIISAKTLTDIEGMFPVSVAQGGTGATTLTSNNVLLGNGTSAVQFVAPGTSGNVLTSNGTTWQSTAPSGGTLAMRIVTEWANGRIDTTAHSGSGTTSCGTGGLSLATGTTASSYARGRWHLATDSSWLQFNRLFELYSDGRFNSPTDGQLTLSVSDFQTASGTGITFTVAQIGFKWVISASTVTLSATCSDGVSETATSIASSMSSDSGFRVSRTALGTVKYYIDGVLKATHTTNIPTSSGGLQPAWIVSNAGTTQNVTASSSFLAMEIQGL